MMIGERLFAVRVSDLSRAWVGWGTLDKKPYNNKHGLPDICHEVMKNRIAAIYPKSAELLKQFDKFFSRITGNIQVKGIFDGLRVIHDTRTNEDVVSLVEFKTTEYGISATTKDMAQFQLQLYIWLLKPQIEKHGYKMSEHHYVEVIRKTDDKLIERIPVSEDKNIEQKIWILVAEHDGVALCPFKKEI